MQQTFLNEFISYLLGTMTPAYFLASLIFLLIGAALNIGIDVFNRDENSANTPKKFSWAFFYHDNRLRFIFNILAAYSFVRFFSDIFPGLTFGLSWAWILGLVFDWVWVAIRELKYLANKKLKTALNNWKKSD
jgi:hypothetical protein